MVTLLRQILPADKDKLIAIMQTVSIAKTHNRKDRLHSIQVRLLVVPE
jgi:hypothetical protein